MAQELILMAEPRTVLGKHNRALRREGSIPGVVYGPTITGTVQVSVNRRDLDRFYQAHGQSTLFTLKWDGGSEQVFIREVQVEPVRHTSLHVDFFAPNLTKELTGQVPVVLHHQAIRAEGVLMQLLEHIDVRGLPSDMPHQLDADISKLTSVGDALHVSDIPLPGSLQAITPADAVVATLVASAAEEAAEGEAAAETTTESEAES